MDYLLTVAPRIQIVPYELLITALSTAFFQDSHPTRGHCMIVCYSNLSSAVTVNKYALGRP